MWKAVGSLQHVIENELTLEELRLVLMGENGHFRNSELAANSKHLILHIVISLIDTTIHIFTKKIEAYLSLSTHKIWLIYILGEAYTRN